MKRFLWVCLFILSSIHWSPAQRQFRSDSTTVSMGWQSHYGKILAHSRSIADLTDSPLWGWQADVSRMRTTQASWDICNCYSQNGISISYFSFNNKKELGSSLSLAVFAEPQLTYGRFNLSLRAGAGLAYLSRVYHPDDNPRNLFFSKPLSGLLLAQVGGRYRLNNFWLVRLATTYHHISNGGNRQPNKGMNFPTASLGLEYSVRRQPIHRRSRNVREDNSLQYYAGLSYNTRAVDGSNFNTRERKTVIGLQAGVYKLFTYMNAVGLGLEISHDGALKAHASQSDNPYDHRVVSGLVQHHFLFGRFDFSQSLGIYLHKKYPEPHKVFQRYAIQYRILENLGLGFSLKAHLHTAEQMDVRVGFLF